MPDDGPWSSQVKAGTPINAAVVVGNTQRQLPSEAVSHCRSV
jgi:hypothetical protein